MIVAIPLNQTHVAKIIKIAIIALTEDSAMLTERRTLLELFIFFNVQKFSHELVYDTIDYNIMFIQSSLCRSM